jgi:hypothetical protein
MNWTRNNSYNRIIELSSDISKIPIATAGFQIEDGNTIISIRIINNFAEYKYKQVYYLLPASELPTFFSALSPAVSSPSQTTSVTE